MNERRRTAITALVLVCLAGCAGAQQGDAPPLAIVTIHEAPERTRADICRAARDWAATSFRDSKAVLEVFDIEAGTMIGKGRMSLLGYAATEFKVDFTMRVECRDGRARSTFDNFLMQSNYTADRYPLREDSLNQLRTKAEARAAAMSADLGRALIAKPF